MGGTDFRSKPQEAPDFWRKTCLSYVVCPLCTAEELWCDRSCTPFGAPGCISSVWPWACGLKHVCIGMNFSSLKLSNVSLTCKLHREIYLELFAGSLHAYHSCGAPAHVRDTRMKLWELVNAKFIWWLQVEFVSELIVHWSLLGLLTSRSTHQATPRSPTLQS